MEKTIDVVDEQGNFVRKAPLEEVIEKALLHRGTRVIVVNREGMLLVQKRSMAKSLYPGHWEIGVGRRVRSGESCEAAAVRGLEEELGINVSNSGLALSRLFQIRYCPPNENVICQVYKLVYNGEVVPNREEVEEAEFLTTTAINELVAKGPLKPESVIAFRKYFGMLKNG